ncbi:MAG: hypothetical protein RLZZ155_554, partial [Bacteroidota bacterium]
MNKRLFIFFIFCCSLGMLHAQNCEYTPTKNVQKLLEKAADGKKYTSDERIVFLEQAFEQDAECLPCMLQLGEMKFLRAKRQGSGFEETIRLYEELKSKCEEYHSEMYYFLGAMHYANQEYDEATE